METFRQQLDLGMAGDQVGVLVRGVKREDVKRGMVLCPPGTVTSNTQIKAQVTADIIIIMYIMYIIIPSTNKAVTSTGVHHEERRRWEAYTVREQLFSSIVHPDS